MLLQAVAQKLGKSPDELQEELRSGNLPQAEQVRALLDDKEQLKSFMGSEKVQQLLREFKKK